MLYFYIKKQPIYRQAGKNMTANKTKILGIVFLVLSCVFAYFFINYKSYCTITDFSDRIISWASANNLDVSKLSALYILFLFLFLAGAFLTAGSLMHTESSDTKTDLPGIQTILSGAKNGLLSKKAVSIVLFVAALAVFILSTNTVLKCVAVSLVFSARYDDTFERLVKKASFLLPAVFGIVTALSFVMVFITGISPEFIDTVLVPVIAFFLSEVQQKKPVVFSRILAAAILLPLSFWFFSEIALTARLLSGTEVEAFTLPLIILIIVIIAAVALIPVNPLQKAADRFCYPVSLIAFSWVYYIGRTTGHVFIDLFESANHGVSISGAVLFGEVPIINNYDAHMLSNTIPGLLYYGMTGRHIVSLDAPYAYFYSVLLCLTVYLVLKQLTTSENAFLIATVFDIAAIVAPSYSMNDNSSFMLGLILFPIYCFWAKKNSLPADLLLWACLAASVLLRLDTGAAFGISALLLSAFTVIKSKNKKRIIRFVVSGLIVTAFLLITALILSGSAKNFSLFVKSFINASLSNQQWAHNHIYYVFAIYTLLPAVFILASAVIYNALNLTENQKAVLLFVTLAFCLNAPRTVIRHNITENFYDVTCFYPLFALIISVIAADRLIVGKALSHSEALTKEKRASFISLMILLVALMTFIQGKIAFSARSDMHDSVTRLSKTVNKTSTKTFTDYDKYVRNLNEYLPHFMTARQTFLDFTNSTELYPLLMRDNPLYVNQTPALINGEKGQRYELERISGRLEDIPIVLMPSFSLPSEDTEDNLSTQIDGILNIDRYYLIAEFIYENYTPLCTVNNTELWCLKDKYDEYASRIDAEAKLPSDTPCNVTHSLGEIPYLLGEGRDKNGSKDEGDCLLISIDSAEKLKDYSVSLVYENGSVDKYTFDIHSGLNYYKVRVSSAYNWYLFKAADVQPEITPEVTVESFEFTYGK